MNPNEPDGTVFDIGVGPSASPPAALDRPAVQRPMVLMALAFMAGVVAGRAIAAPPMFLLGVAGAIAVWAGWGLARERRAGFAAPHSGALLLVAAGLMGWASSNRAMRADARAAAIAEEFAGARNVLVTGRLAEPPERRARSLTLILEDASLRDSTAFEPIVLPAKLAVTYFEGSGRSALAAFDLSELPVKGERIAARGRLRRADAAAFPGDFDRLRYFQSRGIAAQLDVDSADAWSRDAASGGPTNAARRAIARLRAWLVANVKRGLNEKDGNLAAAIFLGDRTGLAPETYDEFRQAGLAHLIAVSGLHVGMILLFVLGLVRAAPIGSRHAHRIAAAIGCVALLLYAALTGFRPPVVRATVMGCVLLGAWGLGRTPSMLNALAASALLTLIWDPRNIARTDWRLSYGCLAAIVLLAEPIYRLPLRDDDASPELRGVWAARSRWFVRSFVWAPLAMTIAVIVGLWPIQAHEFRESTLWGGLANAIAIPATWFVLVASIAHSLLGGIDGLAPIGGSALRATIGFLEWIVEATGLIPAATASTTPPAAWIVGIYYGSLLVGSHLIESAGDGGATPTRQKIGLLARLAFCFGVIGISAFGSKGAVVGRFDLYMLDVGQGEAIVLRFPDGSVGESAPRPVVRTWRCFCGRSASIGWSSSSPRTPTPITSAASSIWPERCRSALSTAGPIAPSPRSSASWSARWRRAR